MIIYGYILAIFAVILEDGSTFTPVAPSTTAETAEGTTHFAVCREKGSLDSTTTKSSTSFTIPSYGTSASFPDVAIGYYTVVLQWLSEEEFLQSRILRPMWSCLELAWSVWILILGWTMARSTQDTKKAKQLQNSWERSRPRRKAPGKKQGKRIKSGCRVSTAHRYLDMAAIISIANLGSVSPRYEPTDPTTGRYETSRRSDFWTPCSHEEPGARILPGSGGILGKMLGQWSADHQTSKPASGSIGENCGKTQGGDCAAQGQLAEVPETGRGRVSVAEGQVLGQAETTARRTTKSGGGVCSSAIGLTRSSCYGREGSRRTSCSGQTYYASSTRSTFKRCSVRCSHGRYAQEIFGSSTDRGRPAFEETAVTYPCGRFPCQKHGQDGFLNGRHASCYNGHARRPRFFCLVEAIIIDIDSTPESVGDAVSQWWDLSTSLPCQPITPARSAPNLHHTYGPRQAEYVAQLMRFDVETDGCNEAFDQCLWDETLENLQYLDNIESSYYANEHQPEIPWNEFVRQIEGSTLWTYMGIDDGNPHVGCIEWTGGHPQGSLSSLTDLECHRVFESLATDSSEAMTILAQRRHLLHEGLEIISYGFFEMYQGQRSQQIPFDQLDRWQHLVGLQWSDCNPGLQFLFHVVTPQPADSKYCFQVLIREMDTQANRNYLLVDQIDESPLNRNERMVVEVSSRPNGYEILLAMHNDIRRISPRTRLKIGTTEWPLHHQLPVQDGQYWMILHETDVDEVTFLQESVTLTPLASDVESSLCPHVFDRWCGNWNGPLDVSGSDETDFMQQARPSSSGERVPHHFFHHDNEHFQLDVPTTGSPDLHELVENHLRLPTTGPSSIRAFHWVSHPPRLGEGNPTVYILELRGDADLRLMNRDVLCLYQLTFEQPEQRGDISTRFRVLWTPHVASRDRILFHLRAADLCRVRTCILYVNGIPWHEHDSIIKQFQDGDFVHLRVIVEPGESVIAARCDFQGYEDTERQRRVFTNATSSNSTPGGDATPSLPSDRSRSRGRNPTASEDEPVEQEEPDSAAQQESEEEEDPSLLQIPVRGPKKTINLHDTVPAPAIIACDFTPVKEARDLIEGLPWILMDLDSLAISGHALDAVSRCVATWQGETPLSYHIYTDGSFHRRQPEMGGCGAILIVQTEQGPMCGGVLSRTCRSTSQAHSAESIAMLWATIVANQVSTHHLKHHAEVPFYLEFGFDAQVSGQHCAGTWTSFKQPLVQRFCRNLVYIVQHRHGFQSLQWSHIRAHQGHLWNETADLLANFALRNPSMVQNSELLYALMDAEAFTNGMDWIWALESMECGDPSLPSLFDGHVYHFRDPIHTAHQPECHFGYASQSTSCEPETVDVLVHLNVATFNVLTLNTRQDRSLGTGSTGRHLSLLQQCDEHELHIVGVQETRALRTTNKTNPYYHVITSPCRSDGHYGIQIWLSHSRPFAMNERPFKDEDYRIVWATPNVLALKLQHPVFRCIVIAARAPTSDKPVQELRAFWNDLTTHILEKFPGWKVILLCDSNSHVGSCPSTSISTFGGETENGAGEIFHDWLLQNSIWLPSTWEHIHHGDHYTFITPTGQHQHRLDFVGLSHNWPLDFVATSVAHTIDGSISRCDHLAAVCSFKAKLPTTSNPSRWKQQGRICDREATAAYLRSHPLTFATMPPVLWQTDVHHHAIHLATETLDHLRPIVPEVRRLPRKRHLTALSWAVVTWKRQLRKHYLETCRRLKYGPLMEVFIAWRGSRRGIPQASPSTRTWMKMMHFKKALLEHVLQRVQPLLQSMLRQDDAQYYERLAKKAGKVETEEGLQGLWKEVKRILPKWKTRRTTQRYDIDEELYTHFANLEAGTTTPFIALAGQCIDHQNEVAKGAGIQRYTLKDLPTLFEIEQTCRKTTLARAPGIDSVLPEVCRLGAPSIARHLHNLILKISCTQTEPVWYKGGLICPIYKAKGPYDDPTSYRGVVLLDVYGKKFHAWLRSRLLPVLQCRRTPGQLGGLPSEQTLTGSHVLRTHGQLARSLRVSSAVVFVDVRAAFHHMLRELIFLHGSSEMDVEALLDSADFDIGAITSLLQERCNAMPSDFPEPLRRLADDVHRHTWFTQRGTSLGTKKVAATVRGTRPGSPVADIGFNLLMSDILADLQQRLQADDYVAAHLNGFPVTIPPITWVDDLAVPLVALHPADLIPLTKQVLQHIHQAFYTKGLQINYSKGKTEVVVMFRGTEADSQRLDFFSSQQETYITTATDTHVFRVRAVASYKHLGVRFQMDSDLTHELQCRQGQARTAFHEVRRPIFCNRHLSHQVRLQLLQSLVFSKLMYGAGTWYEVPRRAIQRLESTVMRFYRSILDTGFWKDHCLTDEEIRTRYQVPTFRSMLAVARLRFLHHVASHGHQYHRDLLLQEREFQKGWLFEVEDDLNWLRACVDLPQLPATPDTPDTWCQFLGWLRNFTPSWKTWLRKAMRTHQLRESLAGECISFHQQVFQTFRDCGAALHEPVEETPAIQRHECPECAATFLTSTGVAVHRAKKHGIHCPIKDYVQSETCPGCLKHMWTSYRVIQHLRYRPNRCLDRVLAGRQPQGYVNVDLPSHLAKVKRLPASRRLHGPLLPLPRDRERVLLRERLATCEAFGAARDFWTPVGCNIQQFANQKLTRAAHQWLQDGTDDGEEWVIKLAEVVAKFPFPELVGHKCVITWIETEMWDALSDWPPEALQTVEYYHMDILKAIPLWNHQTERAHLLRMLQSMDANMDWDPVCIPPIPHPMKQKRALPVATLYGTLEKEEARWRHYAFASSLPSPKACIPPAEIYYIVHLYSGRRRNQDLQWYLEEAFSSVSGIVRIVSIDTAVHSMCDVNDDDTWGLLCALARSGRLLALILGPPCETWSSARHEELQDANGQALQGPRPLRSAACPWGLESLVPKEYRQLRIGMRLLLRGLLLSLMTTIAGGSAILEHPSEPRQSNRASIWRTSVVNLLINSGLFRRFSFEQWRYGGVGVKPTTLLYGNIQRLPCIMKSMANPDAVRPATTLVGRSSDGTFRTGKAKEYPAQMNAAIAACVADRWMTTCSSTLGMPPEERLPEDDVFTPFLNSLHVICSEICEHRSWLPDYQGR